MLAEYPIGGVPDSYGDPGAIRYRTWINEKLSRANILQHKFSIYNGPAVYFLWLGEEIIYIGQARKLLTRIGEHARRKNFDSVSYVPCLIRELRFLEEEAIVALKPKLNKQLIGGIACS